MFSRNSKLFIVCIMLIVIGGVQQVAAVEMEAGTWTQKADMPTARGIAGSAVVDGKIYVIGGSNAQHDSIAVVEEYDPAADKWTRKANMPTGRESLGVAAANGMIYAIGGWSDQFFSTVEAYDPAADKWTKKANMPTLLEPSTVTVDGKIYVIGGRGCGNPSCSIVEVYDPATDTWTKKASMPTGRGRHAVCVVDGRIYALGGATEWDGGEWPCVPTVEVYDPATDTWTQASDMPWPRMGHSASVVDGKIYIVGGQDSAVIKLFNEGKIEGDKVTELFSPVDVYDPATDTWTTAADSPFPTAYHTANVVDGKIYTIGGCRGAEVFSTVEEFDPGLPSAISSVSPAGKLLETWGQIKKAQ